MILPHMKSREDHDMCQLWVYSSMATAAALALVVPLIVWNGAPYVEEGGARYLVDTGASVSCARAGRCPRPRPASWAEPRAQQG